MQPPHSLVLSSRSFDAQPSLPPLAGNAEFLVDVATDGSLLQRFRFDVRHWPQNTLPVRVPADAELLGVKADDQWVARATASDAADGWRIVQIPVAQSGRTHTFELCYRSQQTMGRLWTCLESPLPQLPLETLQLRRIWRLPAGVQPLGLTAWEHIDAAADALNEWTSAAGPFDDSIIVVVQPGVLSGVSWALAAIILLVAWRSPTLAAAPRLCVVLGSLTACILAGLWTPAAFREVAWAPLFALLVLATATCLRPIVRPGIPVLQPRVIVGAVMLYCLLSSGTGRPAEPDPAMVWIIGGSPRIREQSVLAPRDLLDRLDALSRNGGPFPQSAVLVSAHYQGTVMSDRAEFAAEFRAETFTDGPSNAFIPLAGVDLKQASVDNESAYPSTGGPQSGYTLAIARRGMHIVRLQFTVPLAGTKADDRVRFQIPALLQSRMSLRLPSGVAYPRAVFARGIQQVSIDAKGVQLDVDLGKLTNVRVRWQKPDADNTPAAVLVSELHFWDLQGAASRLLSVVQYTVTRGAAVEFSLHLPGAAELISVEVDGLPGGSTTPRLRDWHIIENNGRRHLHLRLQSPITSGCQVSLELVPHTPLGSPVALEVPTPEQAGSTVGYLAYRVQGSSAQVASFSRVTGIEPDDFAALWQRTGVEDPGLPERAYRFQRSPAGGPVVQLRLDPLPLRAHARENFTWLIERSRAELQASTTIDSPANDISLVEWDVAAEVHVTDVSGPNIRSWSRSGNRLQAWLEESVREATLSLSGWSTHAGALPSNGFNLPPIRCTSALRDWATVQFRSPTGFRLRVTPIEGLWTLPSSDASETEQTFVCRQATFGGQVLLIPTATRARVQTTTVAERGGDELTFATTVECRAEDEETRDLTLQLHHAQGYEVHIDGDKLVSRQPILSNAQTRSWLLKFQPGTMGRYLLRVVARAPVRLGRDVAVPDVTVDGTAVSARYVCVPEQLFVEQARGVVRLPVRHPERLSPVAEAAQRSGAAVWAVQTEEWHMQLRSRSPASPSAAVQVFLVEQQAAVVDGHHWLHQAAYWICHPTGTEFSFSLPEGAHLVGLTLDDQEVAPLRPDPAQVWLPLPGSPNLRCLQVRWSYDPNTERFNSPRLDRPALEGVDFIDSGDAAAHQWMVRLPADYDLQSTDAHQIAADALRQRRDQAYQRFKELTAENVAPGVRVDRTGDGDDLPGDGVVTYWEAVTESAAHVQLYGRKESAFARTLLGSGILLTALIAAWLLLRVPHWRALSTVFEPEQIVLIGVLGGWLLQSPIFLSCVVALGIGLRGWLLYRRLIPTEHVSRTASIGAGSGVSSAS
jgi:hypothetical protein